MKRLIISISILLIVVLGYYFYTQANSDSQVTTYQKSINEKTTYQDETVTSDTTTTNTMTTENYIEYSPEALAEAHQKGRVVLFFHASWCPTCKAANEELLKNSSRLPDDVTILKTDYDTYTELKQKYGVTYQHTFVQVDAQGNEIAKWNGGGVDTILKNLK